MSSDLFVDITLPNGKIYKQPIGLFINNEFVAAKTGEFIETVDPSSGEVITKVHKAGVEDVDLAVQAAKKAFPAWKKLDGAAKRDLFWKLATLVERDAETIAALEAYDSGKPLSTNAVYDVEEVVEALKYYAGWADKVTGKSVPLGNKLGFTLHEPYGVVGCITPWNYPLAMFGWKLTCLAAGNCAVFKSSELTPLSVLYFAQLFKEAGFPPGVANIVSGYGYEAGNALVEHLDISKIAFTGSTVTGQAIQKAAAINLKALSLECGGKTAMLVFSDADFDQAVKWGAVGIFSNMGQICTGSSRMYIHESIYEKFLEALKAHVLEDYKQGHPFEDGVVVGPQVSGPQQEKILGYLKSGKEQGARVILGGGIPEGEKFSKGFYIQPTIFADVTKDMKIVQEEIFGPVVSIGKFSTDEEAVELANDSVYGLGAALFTQDITRAHKVSADLEAGMVWINSNNDSDIKLPFGGVKMSGYGRELGEYGLEHFTEAKAVHINLGNRL
jgi:aldehyde dehydrogenase (NAD(P)+)